MHMYVKRVWRVFQTVFLLTVRAVEAARRRRRRERRGGRSAGQRWYTHLKPITTSTHQPMLQESHPDKPVCPTHTSTTGLTSIHTHLGRYSTLSATTNPTRINRFDAGRKGTVSRSIPQRGAWQCWRRAVQDSRIKTSKLAAVSRTRGSARDCTNGMLPICQS